MDSLVPLPDGMTAEDIKPANPQRSNHIWSNKKFQCMMFWDPKALQYRWDDREMASQLSPKRTGKPPGLSWGTSSFTIPDHFCFPCLPNLNLSHQIPLLRFSWGWPMTDVETLVLFRIKLDIGRSPMSSEKHSLTCTQRDCQFLFMLQDRYMDGDPS